jgi:hypothetical protein
MRYYSSERQQPVRFILTRREYTIGIRRLISTLGNVWTTLNSLPRYQALDADAMHRCTPLPTGYMLDLEVDQRDNNIMTDTARPSLH